MTPGGVKKVSKKQEKNEKSLIIRNFSYEVNGVAVTPITSQMGTK